MTAPNNRAQDMGNGTTRIFGNCVFTGETYECTVPTEGFNKWQAGEPVQRSFPQTPAADREFLISGISPAGCEKTFGKE